MRTMALDYGTVRIGVAISDPLGIIAQPKGYIEASPVKSCLGTIAELCANYGIQRIVLGLPLHMKGHEGKSAQGARCLGTKIESKLNIAVTYIDERLSTVTAHKILDETKVRQSKKKSKIDSVAAAVILQTYLDRESGDVMP
ncbi:MAG: Holliday junction resolvase RuvX [Victivallales bacterium]|nr:Holliday junction resolvase RuvX [Victivallales bacterium]